MGRAGRGGGSGGGFRGGSGRGGGRSFGGSRGGGRRLGGHPGNSRAGRGGFGSSTSSGSHSNSGHRYRRRPIFMPGMGWGGWGPRRWRYGGFGRGPRPGCGGCMAPGCIWPLLILLGLFILFSVLSGPDTYHDDSHSSDKIISNSTVDREPIEYGLVDETPYYRDEIGWIKDEGELEVGMSYFYEMTNVQPFLYLVKDINGNENPSPDDIDEFAYEAYEELFTDEAHLLLVFFENENYDYHHSYHTVYGSQAKQLMDSEAEDILFDYLDYYYTADMSEDEYFSTVFYETADRIIVEEESETPSWLWLLGIAAIALLLYQWYQSHQKAATAKEKSSDRDVNAPDDDPFDRDFDEFDF